MLKAPQAEHPLPMALEVPRFDLVKDMDIQPLPHARVLA